VAKPLILVTGATGAVGSEVVKQLAEAGESVRILTRDPGKAKKFGKSVEVIQGDLEKPETLAPAFTGVDKVFVLSNYPLIAVLEGNAYVAAKAAEVKQIVKLSGRHVNADFFSGTALAKWHIESEQRLQSLGIPWTILRPGSFASNFLLWFDRQNSAIFLPVGEGKDSFIDPRDIAACAAKLLTTSGHDGRIYEITGSEHLSFAQLAEKISAAIGKKVSYQSIPEEALRQGLLSMGIPAPTAESFITFFAAVRNGKIYPPTSAVADLLGRPPRSFDEWARDNAAALR
jgi:(4-alkanoyl-5-oxo-2,5-dihydrofuran-3-yl)methyl phosphate reductase